jgi:hypothetical protein
MLWLCVSCCSYAHYWIPLRCWTTSYCRRRRSAPQRWQVAWGREEEAAVQRSQRRSGRWRGVLSVLPVFRGSLKPAPPARSGRARSSANLCQLAIGAAVVVDRTVERQWASTTRAASRPSCVPATRLPIRGADGVFEHRRSEPRDTVLDAAPGNDELSSSLVTSPPLALRDRDPNRRAAVGVNDLCGVSPVVRPSDTSCGAPMASSNIAAASPVILSSMPRIDKPDSLLMVSCMK